MENDQEVTREVDLTGRDEVEVFRKGIRPSSFVGDRSTCGFTSTS